jgi:hypothetical protein
MTETKSKASVEMRIEHDSMGEVKVPKNAYYSSQTQRAVENFPISGQPLPTELIRAMGLVKFACGVANRDLGKLSNTGKVRLDADLGDAASGRGSCCRQIRRPISNRYLSNGFRNLEQHELQRSHREPGH